MIATWKSQPRKFGAIAFGIIGLSFGLLETAPWSAQGIFLLQGVVTKLLWTCFIVTATAVLGYNRGPRFVRQASKGYFARAAGTATLALVCATVATILVYCITLVVIGDFGVSLGIFGSFKPPYTLLQKLMAIVVTFFTGLWICIFIAVINGFIGGYLFALFFAPAYQHNGDA